MLPVRIQNGVDRRYRAEQEALWEDKSDEADDRVKVILAKEFSEYFKKKFLDSFEEGSDLYEENKRILNAAERITVPREINIIDENTEVK